MRTVICCSECCTRKGIVAATEWRKHLAASVGFCWGLLRTCPSLCASCTQCVPPPPNTHWILIQVDLVHFIRSSHFTCDRKPELWWKGWYFFFFVCEVYSEKWLDRGHQQTSCTYFFFFFTTNQHKITNDNALIKNKQTKKETEVHPNPSAHTIETHKLCLHYIQHLGEHLQNLYHSLFLSSFSPLTKPPTISLIPTLKYSLLVCFSPNTTNVSQTSCTYS